LPALSLPCGLDEAGMPFGLQSVGGFRGDHELLGAAAAMEQVFAASAELRRPRPAVDALRAVEPALTSIVKSPPVYGGGLGGGALTSAA
jgi:hypothetical protein